MIKHGLKIGLALSGLSILLLSGCHGHGSNPASGATGNVSGSVRDGLGPIANSHITIYEATAAAPIILGQAVSDAQGNFSLSYHVPSLGAYVYGVANGGVVNGVNNPNINLITVMGEGPNIANSLTINEITTVGAYQALTNNWSKTAATPTLIVGPNSATAMSIGFTNYQNLVNQNTGALSSNFPLTTTVNSTGYQLATRANVLALCVQNAAYCSTLASNAYLNTGATDTFHLMAGLKTTDSTQRANVTTLLQSAGLPALPYAANTLDQSALKIVIDGPSTLTANSIAIDSLGNVWTGNFTIHAVIKTLVGSVSNSTILQTYAGFNDPYGIAIDSENNTWVTNNTADTVTEILAGSTASNPILRAMENEVVARRPRSHEG